MDDETKTDPLALEIVAIRLEAARRLAPALRRLDVAGMETWKTLTEAVLAAGVPERRLIEELSVARSTIDRWAMGHTAPGPQTRVAIRNKMADMVDEVADAMEARLAASASDGESPRP